MEQLSLNTPGTRSRLRRVCGQEEAVKAPSHGHKPLIRRAVWGFNTRVTTEADSHAITDRTLHVQDARTRCYNVTCQYKHSFYRRYRRVPLLRPVYRPDRFTRFAWSKRKIHLDTALESYGSGVAQHNATCPFS